MAGLALAVPAIFVGGISASAEDIPTGDTTSQGVIAPTSDAVAAPAAADTTTDQTTVTESAPAPAGPIVESPTQSEAATVVAPAPSVSPAAENTQPSPPKDEVVVVDDEAATTAEQSKTGPVTPPVKDCVKDKGGSWTIDWATGAGTITLVGGPKALPGDKVCDPIALRPTLWHFLEVEKQWKQGNAQTNDKLVDTIGTTTFQIPGWPTTCVQADGYAARVSNGGFDALKLPEFLEGPGQPFEPPFLHSVLSGTGNSYFVTSAKGCNVPVPEKVTGTATFEVLSCLPGSKNQVVTDVVRGGIWSISDDKGLTRDLAAIGAGYTGGLPEGLPYGTDYTVSLRDGDASDLYDVTPWKSGVWTPVKAPVCYTIDAAAFGTSTEETCTEASKQAFEIYNATWNEPADLTVGDHVRTATALPGHRFYSQSSPEGSTTATVFYTIKAALGHQSTDVNAPCYVAPPTTTTPPTVPVSNVQHPLPPKPPVLASTGAEIGGGLALVALLLAAGVALLVGRSISRRREATNE